VAKKATLTLLPHERLRLQNIIDRGTNWRERERAKTLILFDDGQSMRVIAENAGIDIRTVGLTRMDWLKRGFESLVDAPRTGAPKKITPEQLENLLDAAEKVPLTAKALLAIHVDAGEMVLAYCDEAGFSQVHPNRSAWTPKGERHLIPAIRGKRLNVLAPAAAGIGARQLYGSPMNGGKGSRFYGRQGRNWT